MYVPRYTYAPFCVGVACVTRAFDTTMLRDQPVIVGLHLVV